VKTEDRNLGMDRPISRRDLLHGVGAMAAASLVPGQSLANQILAPAAGSAGYPPALTGMILVSTILSSLGRESVAWQPPISIGRRIRMPASSFSTITTISAAMPGVTSSALPAAS